MTAAIERIGKCVLPIETCSPAGAGGGHFLYVDISSIDRESKSITTAMDVLAADAPSRARQVLRANDVLVSSVRPNLNAVAMVPAHLDRAIGSTGFTVLRVNPQRLEARYLFHWVRSPGFVSNMVKNATGASYPAVSDRVVLGSSIPIPPLSEQRRIADILDKADAVRRKRKETIALTEQLLRSAFLEMFGDPVTNPKGWETTSLGAVCEVAGGLQVTTARAGNPILLPYLRVANVFRDRLDLAEIKYIRVTSAEHQRAILRAGDVLIVEGHGNPQELGRAAVWSSEIADCTHQNHLIRVRASSRVLRPIFLSAFINSSAGRTQMLRFGKTTSGLNTISTNNVRSVNLLLPPLAVQDGFERAARKVHQLSTRLAVTAEQDSALFASLVHQAFESRKGP